MPIYEYECVSQGHRFEVLQKMSDAPIENCPECGGKVRKLISAAGFMLKGSGWYKDGYASNKKSESSEKPSSVTEAKKPETSSSTESKKTETSTPTQKEIKS